MRLQITHLKAPWPIGAVVGDVLDLPAIPAWAAGKCKCVGDDVSLTIITGDGLGEALPSIATGEGEGVGQPSPGIESSDEISKPMTPFEGYVKRGKRK